MIKRLVFFTGFVIASMGGFVTLHTVRTYALGGSDWQAGNIIDDAVFTDATSMSMSDIQTFLNQQDPNCDTWGTQKATDWGRSDLTHAQFASLKGWPAPPYVCLKQYYEVPKTSASAGMPDNSYNHYDSSSKTLLPVPGGVSAAQLIYNAAQQYHINPKVLLVKIQTESAGPLTQDTWPLPSQYTYAMGADCPDSGPGGSAQCDPNYAGFSIQISEAAKLMRYYLDNMQQPWWTHARPFQTNNVLWNVTTSGCGGSNVFIQTKGTAALYTYTPYQPNAAALAKVSNTSSGGTGDGCSAYGNRNFWWWFNTWFGSSHESGEILQNSLSTNTLTAGALLNAGDFIVSPNGKFVTTMQYDGNLVTYNSSTAVWSSGTYDNYGAYATFQSDNNLVIYAANGSALWASNTSGPGVGSISLGDDGNLSMYTGNTLKCTTNKKGSLCDTTTVKSQLSPGGIVSSGKSLQSPDGHYFLAMQSDGNLVVYSADNTALWNAGTYGNPGAFLAMQSDGNLVVYSSSGKPLWGSGTSSNGAFLAMQSDGNLVVYSADNTALWNSSTWQNNYQMIPHGGDQLTSGTVLKSTEYLQSSDWRYRLVMQSDGNLVVYSANKNVALWDSGTWGNPGAYAAMQSDGNLVVYSSSGQPLWGAAGKGTSSLAMQSDGNLVVYSSSGPTWASGTNGKF